MNYERCAKRMMEKLESKEVKKRQRNRWMNNVTSVELGMKVEDEKQEKCSVRDAKHRVMARRTLSDCACCKLQVWSP